MLFKSFRRLSLNSHSPQLAARLFLNKDRYVAVLPLILLYVLVELPKAIATILGLFQKVLSKNLGVHMIISSDILSQSKSHLS